jgi:hypothetical protein
MSLPAKNSESDLGSSSYLLADMTQFSSKIVGNHEVNLCTFWKKMRVFLIFYISFCFKA